MAKRTVLTKHGDDIPFLRGILVKSIVRTGLSFDEAYELAQTVRDNLDDDFEITYSELSSMTADLIEKKHGIEYRRAYEECPHTLAESIVVHTSSKDVPFSPGVLAYNLEAYGIDSSIAMKCSQIVFRQLNNYNYEEINSTEINVLTYRCLRDNFSQNIADTFISWKAFEDSEKSLLLLIGGVTGVGKSTVSHEICYRLDIPQIQSTDMIREIIRAYLAPPIVPFLQYSSFEAFKAIPDVKSKRGLFKKSPPVVEGFLSQLSILQPALQSSINRALQEENHMIIEGVHILPTEIDLDAAREKAVIVPVMLANTSKSSLKKQLTRRGSEQTERPSARYIENLEHIWTLQSYLLKTADNAEIPILANSSIKDTVSSVIALISEKIVDNFPPEDYRDKWDKATLHNSENL